MQATAAPSIQARVDGQVTGQVAVGTHILQIGSIHGGVVHVAAPAELPRPRPRATPVRLLPRPFPGMIGRERETRAVSDALSGGESMEVHGDPGLGKTSLLRRLAHCGAAAAFPDGVVHLFARGRPAGELCQGVWDALYECDAAYVPTPATLRGDLAGARMLVILDELTLDADEVQVVMDAAPACTFLWSSEARRGPADVRPLRLAGLPPDDAAALLERELGRALSPDEASAAGALCRAVGGSPLRLVQAAAAVRDDGLPLDEVARRAGAAHLPLDAPATGGEEAVMLNVLAAFGGAPVGTRLLAEVAGIDAGAALAALERRGVALGDGEGRWRAPAAVLAEMDTEVWVEKALPRATEWAEANRDDPAAVAAEADALLALLDRAADARKWEAVLRLGRAIEGPLALARRLDAWETVLRRIEQAGREREDRAAIAHALHQLGTRAACLALPGGDELLRQAFGMRTALGDHAAAAVSRHNLHVAFGTPPAAPHPGHDGGAAGHAAKAAKAAGHAAAKAGAVKATVVAGTAVLCAGAVIRFVPSPAPQPRPADVAAPHSVQSIPAAPPAAAPVTLSAPTPAEQPSGNIGAPSMAAELAPRRRSTGSAPRTHGVARAASVADAGAQRVGMSRLFTVPVTNAGNAPLRVHGAGLAAGEGFGVRGGCDAPVLPGGSCALTVEFTPAREGAHAATLLVRHDGDGSPLRVALHGEGTAPPPPESAEPDPSALPAADPADIDFGDWPRLALSPPHAVLVRNTEDKPMTITDVRVAGPDASDFVVFLDGCRQRTLPVGGACRVVVRFHTSSLGRRTAELRIGRGDAGELTISLAGSGRTST